MFSIIKIIFFLFAYIVYNFTLLAQAFVEFDNISTQKQDLVQLYSQVSIDEIKEITNTIASDSENARQRLLAIAKGFYNSLQKLDIENRLHNINEYDSSFLDIFSEKEKLNINDKRLLFQKLSSKSATQKFILNAPNLFLLHRSIAQAYLKSSFGNAPYYLQATYHYNQAMQYRPLNMTDQVFSDAIRTQLSQNLEEDQVSKRYRELSKSLEEFKSQLTKLKPLYALSQDTGDTKRAEELHNNIVLLNSQIDTVQKNLETLNFIIISYKQKWNNDSADFLVEVAATFHKIEEVQKQKTHAFIKEESPNTSSIENTIYTHHNFFSKYTKLLEQAFLLDTFNPEIPYLIALESSKRLKVAKSISYYKKALATHNSLEKRFALSIEQRFQAHLSLAGLLWREKRYTEAAEHYESVWGIAQVTPDLVDYNILFELAQINVKHLGNYKKSQTYSQAYLKHYAQEIEQKNWLKSSLVLKNAVLLYQSRAYIFQRSKDYDGSKEAYEKAIDLLIALQTSILEMLSEKKMFKERIHVIRVTSSLAPAVKWKREMALQEELRQVEEILQTLLSKYKSVPKKNIFFGLARLFEFEKNVLQAIETYKDAHSLNIASSESLYHIKRLQSR